MLIITRKPGQKIMIGENVVLHVLDAPGGSVRLGIEAPRSLPIYREEIWNALRQARPASVPAPTEPPSPPPP